MRLGKAIDYRQIGTAECRLGVEPLEALADRYDAVVGVLGYEQRSAFVPTCLAERSDAHFATAFGTNEVLQYDHNRKALIRHNFEIQQQRPDELRVDLAKWLSELPDGNERAVRVALDVSSMSRARIGQALLAACDAAQHKSLVLDVLYAPAEYQAPPVASSTITIAEPVAYEFAGWPVEPELPMAAIIGLGYEVGRAIGMTEYLDADRVWGFVPVGGDARFAVDVEVVNRIFWEDQRVQRVPYPTLEPFRAFVQLESLVYGLGATHRVTVVPFGPKIFAVNALLTGLLHPDVCSVWRVSAGDLEPPRDQRAAGTIVGMTASLSPLTG